MAYCFAENKEERQGKQLENASWRFEIKMEKPAESENIESSICTMVWKLEETIRRSNKRSMSLM